MRQLGSLVLGIGYSVILSSALTSAVRSIASDHSDGFGEHYVLLAIAWLIGIGIAAYLSAMASRTYPLTISVLSTLPIPIVYLYFFLTIGSGPLDFRLPPLMFGWGPTALGFVILLCILSVLTGFVAGRAATDELRRGQESEHDDHTTTAGSISPAIMGIHWGHWFWLWIPMALWIYVVPYAVYSAWLAVATGWHWAIHPSLWFDWHWWLFNGLGVVFVIYPLSLLHSGIVGAWLALVQDNELSRGAAARDFAIYGFGVAILATTICLEIGGWFLARLPIVANHGKPWWVF